jgi:hypothetical protein
MLLENRPTRFVLRPLIHVLSGLLLNFLVIVDVASSESLIPFTEINDVEIGSLLKGCSADHRYFNQAEILKMKFSTLVRSKGPTCSEDPNVGCITYAVRNNGTCKFLGYFKGAASQSFSLIDRVPFFVRNKNGFVPFTLLTGRELFIIVDLPRYPRSYRLK